MELYNPHSVFAALLHRPKDVKRIVLSEHGGSTSWGDVKAKALELDILLSEKKDANETSRRTGSYAEVLEKKPTSLELLINQPKDQNFWIALDSLQDPNNVGSIFRTAAFFGSNGIIMTKNRASPMSSVVYDVASGGVEAIPFSIETNLNRSLQKMKDKGLWILGTSEHAQKNLSQLKRDRPWVIVVGNEENGIRPNVLKQCDELYAIKPKTDYPVTSLNVAVTSAIVAAQLS